MHARWLTTYRILELSVDLGDDGSHRVKFGKHVLLSSTTKHGAHLQADVDALISRMAQVAIDEAH